MQLKHLCALAALAFSSSVFAQARINSVSYDLVSGTLVISGEDLKGTLAATTVKLAGTSLTVLSSTATTLTAQLPVNQGYGEFGIYLKRGLLSALESVALSEASYSLSIVQPIAGPQGEQGIQGAPGISGYQVMTTTSANDSAESRILTATCPNGKIALGGGTLLNPVTPTNYRAISVPTSKPAPNNTGWQALAIEVPTNYTANWQLSVYAICATVSP